jgi:hypothetical protein
VIDSQDEEEHRDEIANLEAKIDDLERGNRALRDLVVELSLGKAAAEWELRNPEPRPKPLKKGLGKR